MAVRTAYAPVAGTAITAANHSKFPGGWIGYAERTTNQGTITAQVDIASVTVTVTAGSSRRLLAEASCRIDQAGSAANAEAYVLENAAVVSKSSITHPVGAAAMHFPKAVRTPSAGFNTYNLAAATGAGVAAVIATSDQPAFILVQDIGPAS